MKKKVNILLACYGGGHVQSLIPIAKQLNLNSDFDLYVIGFTTAYHTFINEGIDAKSYKELLTPEDYKWQVLAKDLIKESGHPNVDYDDTIAYHAIGLKELSYLHGEEKAIEIYKEDGRRSFLPISTFKRYINNRQIDLVITSTSPRSELALQYAASELKIPSIAISDLFLQKESEYICNKNYAKTITVISKYVADYLVENGCDEERIKVFGNPAFDNLFNPKHKNSADIFRKKIDFKSDEKIILWICPSARMSMIGKEFVDPDKMLWFLEEFCKKHNNYRYLVRQHPSNPIIDNFSSNYGVECPNDVSIEVCITVSNIVILETSTVGLQAALLNKPVVTINSNDYPPYAKLGLATDTPNLAAAEDAILEERKPTNELLGYPIGTCSTDMIVQYITDEIIH